MVRTMGGLIYVGQASIVPARGTAISGKAGPTIFIMRPGERPSESLGLFKDETNRDVAYEDIWVGLKHRAPYVDVRDFQVEEVGDATAETISD